ncbi:MAG: response regulator [Alphaproteobacteria bacterium]|nr:response regulator [Alphaproteobacteria bacterium]
MATVLVIDDDIAVRTMVHRMLAGAGYSVLEAGNGRDGLKLFEQRDPDLVITEVIMPDMDGIETMRALRKLRPAARVLAISGGRLLAQDALRYMATFGACATLEKPFDRRQLLDTVRRVLDHDACECSPFGPGGADKTDVPIDFTAEIAEKH